MIVVSGWTPLRQDWIKTDTDPFLWWHPWQPSQPPPVDTPFVPEHLQSGDNGTCLCKQLFGPMFSLLLHFTILLSLARNLNTSLLHCPLREIWTLHYFTVPYKTFEHFITSLSLTSNLGCLTWVRHSSCKSNAYTHSHLIPIPINVCSIFMCYTHSHQCLQYFHVLYPFPSMSAVFSCVIPIPINVCSIFMCYTHSHQCLQYFHVLYPFPSMSAVFSCVQKMASFMAASVWDFLCAHMCADACDYTQGLCRHRKQSLHWKMTLGEISLPTVGTQTRISIAPGFSVRHSTKSTSQNRLKSLLNMAWLEILY